MSEPLYALGQQLSAVFEEIEAELAATGGEYTPEMEAKLAAVEIPFRDKCERVALRYREQMAKAGAAGLEEDRLAKRKKALERDASWLLSYLQHEMEAQKVERIEGALVTVRIQQNNPAASVSVPLEMIPPAFVRVAPEKRELDKQAVLEAWRRGEALPEGISVTRSKSVRIS